MARALLVVWALLALAFTSLVGADEATTPYVLLDKPEGAPVVATRIVVWPEADKTHVSARLDALRAKAPGLFSRAALYGRVRIYRATFPPRDPRGGLTAWHDRPTRAIVVNPAAFEKKDAEKTAAHLDWDLVRALASCADPLWHAARSEAWHALAAQWQGGPRGTHADDGYEALTEYVTAVVLPTSPLLPKDNTVPESVAKFVRDALLTPAGPAEDDQRTVQAGFVALSRLGKPDDALKLANEVLKRDAKDADALFLKGLALIRRKAPKDAVKVFSAALEAMDEHDAFRGDIYVYRGRMRGMTGQLAPAMADMEQAVAVNERNGEAWYWLGLLRMNTKKPDAALDAFTKAIACLDGEPGAQAMAYRYRGKLHQSHKKDVDAALEDLTKSLTLDPRNVEAMLERADILVSKQRFAEALFGYVNVLRTKKGHARALAGHARALRGLGRKEAAVKAYRKAIEAAPKAWRLHFELGEVEAERGELEAAITGFTKVIEGRKKAPREVFLQRGIAYAKLKRFADAIPDLENAASAPAHAKAAAPWLERAREGAGAQAEQQELLDALAPDEGLLVLDAPAGAQAWIDGKRRGTERSFTFGGLGEGMRQPHHLTLNLPDGSKARRTFFVGRGTITRLSVHARSHICLVHSGRVYVIDPETGTRKALTDDDTLEWSWPTLSPDGRHVAASAGPWKSRAGLTDDSIYVLPVDGGPKRKVGPGFQPIWSPDGKQLCYERSVRGLKEKKAAKDWKGYYDLYVVGALGGTPRRLTEGEDPTWAPDGARIAFTRPLGKERTSPHAIFTIRTGGEDLRRLQEGSGPRWSPDGTRIAFSRESHAYVMNADGSAPKRFATADWLRWSPDGSWIAYGREEAGGGPASWVVRSGGGQAARRLGVGYASRWSPDGSRLALTRPVGRPDPDTGAVAVDLEVIRLDGGGRVRLTRFARILRRKGKPTLLRSVEDVAWSPHGTRIAYIRFDGEDMFMDMWGDSDLHVVNVDGRGDRRLLSEKEGGKRMTDLILLRLIWQ